MAQSLSNQGREIQVSSATVDNLGNLYFANTENEIFKEGPEGNRMAYYSNNSLGNIGSIDATSPLKVLIFYPSFSTCIVLDRRLLETSRFNLIDLGLGEINTIAFSRDGTLWVFDDHEQRLLKVNTSGAVILQSDDLRLVFNERIRPTKAVEAGGAIYLNVPDRGILVFDLYGQYKTQILEVGLTDFQVVNEATLVYFKEGELVINNYEQFEMQHIALPSQSGQAKTLFTKSGLIQVNQDGIERMSLEEFFPKKD